MQNRDKIQAKQTGPRAKMKKENSINQVAKTENFINQISDTNGENVRFCIFKFPVVLHQSENIRFKSRLWVKDYKNFLLTYKAGFCCCLGSNTVFNNISVNLEWT